MNHPKISIVTPSLNQAGFLEQTIRSVLDQAYPNLEYIVIDGGSTDGSVEIIKKYEKYLMYWVSQPDNGQTHAINVGFRMCTGDLVAWQNSDDFYLPGAFEKVARAWQETEADVFFGHKYNVDSNGDVIRPLCYTPYDLRTILYEGIMVMANQATFWRRDLFDRLGYLDERLDYAMDYDFFLRLGLNASKFRSINDFLGCFRLHGDAKSTQLSDKWAADLAYVDQKYHIERRYKRLHKALSMLRRTYYYLRQGRFSYVYSGMIKRMVGA